MKLLFVSNQLLFKDTRFGGAKRLYQFASQLQEKCELYLICFDVSNEIGSFNKNRKYNERAFSRFLYFPHAKIPLFCKYFFLDDFLIKKNRRKILAFLDGTHFDAVYIAFSASLSTLNFEQIRIHDNITYSEDDLVLVNILERMKSAASLIRKLVWYSHYRLALRYYKKRMQPVRNFVAISEEERKIFTEVVPSVNSYLIKYGVNPGEYPFLPANFSSVLGFIGNFNHLPNLQAFEFFLAKIFPSLIARVPGVIVHVAGLNLSKINLPPNLPGHTIFLRENVPNLSDFYKDIGIFINPVTSGKGLRTKLIEAAAFGRPIVSTHLGAEGLSDLEILIADCPGEFSLHCKKLLESREQYKQTCLRNREVIEKKYSALQIGNQLYNVLFNKAGISL